MCGVPLARIPFILGAVPIFVLFFLTLLTWWWTMVALWNDGLVYEGILVAYLVPIIFLLVSALVIRSPRLNGLLHYAVLAVVGIVLALRVATLVPFVPLDTVAKDWGPLLGIAFISGVVTIMTYPKAGGESYHRYRSPLFVGGVIFMPLFIAVAAALSTPLAPALKGVMIVSIMVGFWSSAAWLASRRTQGDYVPGLELKPMMAFRPDLILPGGVNYVKGTIMTGLGYMLMAAPVKSIFPPPVWNWWGFVLAFWGIITIIPLRGMFKMVTGTRLRMLGYQTAFGFNRNLWVRESWLYLGLLILMYGFLNAFMGTIPFTKLSPFSPLVNPANPWHGVVGTLLVVLAYVVLVPIRGWYKVRLKEGAESTGQLVLKNVLLWVGTFLLIYGFVTLFMGVFTYPVPDAFRLAVGLPIFVGGIVLTVVLRPLALRNEFIGTMRMMPGLLANLPDEKRKAVMSRRINTLLAMTERQRDIHVKEMVRGIGSLREDLKERVLKTNLELISGLPAQERMIMMRAMDKAFGMSK
jgi:hypothetical protein